MVNDTRIMTRHLRQDVVTKHWPLHEETMSIQEHMPMINPEIVLRPLQNKFPFEKEVVPIRLTEAALGPCAASFCFGLLPQIQVQLCAAKFKVQRSKLFTWGLSEVQLCTAKFKVQRSKLFTWGLSDHRKVIGQGHMVAAIKHGETKQWSWRTTEKGKLSWNKRTWTAPVTPFQQNDYSRACSLRSKPMMLQTRLSQSNISWGI